MEAAGRDSEILSLRNRFKHDAELLLQAVTEQDEKSKEVKPLPRVNRHSVFWILASVALTYYVDFFTVILENSDIKSWWFNVGVVLLGVSVSLAGFCIVYLEWIKGIKHYDQEYPAVPPITTAAFIAASCRSVSELHLPPQLTITNHQDQHDESQNTLLVQ
uniref:Transmembrane protein 128 n=1 Tax=Astyanax mexicanus TaxID=7994 RepID=A0A8B9HKZ5_ASTMX